MICALVSYTYCFGRSRGFSHSISAVKYPYYRGGLHIYNSAIWDKVCWVFCKGGLRFAMWLPIMLATTCSSLRLYAWISWQSFPSVHSYSACVLVEKSWWF